MSLEAHIMVVAMGTALALLGMPLWFLAPRATAIIGPAMVGVGIGILAMECVVLLLS
jgi:hypothetical protein